MSATPRSIPRRVSLPLHVSGWPTGPTVPLAILVLSLLATYIAWQAALNHRAATAAAEFERDVDAIRVHVQRDLDFFEDELEGFVGLYASSHSVERDQFSTYLSALHVSDRPGLWRTCFLERVPADARAAYEQRVRSDTSLRPEGYPNFAIHPDGDRPEYIVATYLEPLDQNALGLDIATEPTRRAALERARDSGAPAATALLHLIVDPLHRPALAMFAPIYRNGQAHDTVPQRREALQGFVGVALQLDALFASDLDLDEHPGVRIQIHDVASDNALLYDSGPTRASSPSTMLHIDQYLQVSGRTWALHFTIDSRFAVSLADRWYPTVVGLIGLTFSLLLFGTLYALSTSRRRALAIAESMTRELRQQRDMLLLWERALSSTTDGVIITDPRKPDNPIIYCNPAFERMFGYSQAEAIGRNPRFLQGHERGQEGVEELRRAVAESRACRVTVRNYRKNGELFWNELSIAPVLDEEGRVMHYIGVQHDMTEQKLADQRVQESHEQTEQLVSSISSILIGVNLSGEVIRWNTVAESVFGVTVDVALRRRLDECGLQWEGSRVWDAIEECRQTRRATRVNDVPFKTRVGRNGLLGMTITPMNDTSGQLSGFLMVAADITERKRAERRLATQYEVARILAESFTLRVAAGQLTRAVCEGLGWDAGELWMIDRQATVLRCLDVWHRADLQLGASEAATRSASYALGSGLPGCVWKAHEPVWVEDLNTEQGAARDSTAQQAELRGACGFPIINRGQVVGVMTCYTRDVCQPEHEYMPLFLAVGNQMGQFIERKQLEEEIRQKTEDLVRSHEQMLQRQKVTHSLLEDLQTSKEQLEHQSTELQTANARLQELARLKDEFVANVSHELRTPLTAIKEGISLLLDQALGNINDEQRDFLQTIDESIERLTELITNMLDLSKIEAGRLRLLRRPIDVRKLIEMVLSSYRALAGNRQLKTYLVTAPEVFADPNRILQVLGNLVSNAVKFTNDAGVITLTVHRQNGAVAISVQDSGAGIAKDDLPKLFRKFSQVGGGLDKTGGTGLGLALCKELVELHKGSISVESEPGKGSTFTFTLPIFTPWFALEESFKELVEFAERNKEDGVGLILLDCEPIIGPGTDEDESHRRRLQQMAEVVTRHVHRGDVVLPISPQWVVVLAIAGAEGVRAIVDRLEVVLREEVSRTLNLSRGFPITFRTTLYPIDGDDVQTLFQKATVAAPLVGERRNSETAAP